MEKIPSGAWSLPERGPDMDSDEKLLVTATAKVSVELSRRWQERARNCGLKDGQMYRLILERIDEIFEKAWDPRINPAFFLALLTVDTEQLKPFFADRAVSNGADVATADAVSEKAGKHPRAIR